MAWTEAISEGELAGGGRKVIKVGGHSIWVGYGKGK